MKSIDQFKLRTKNLSIIISKWGQYKNIYNTNFPEYNLLYNVLAGFKTWQSIIKVTIIHFRIRHISKYLHYKTVVFARILNWCTMSQLFPKHDRRSRSPKYSPNARFQTTKVIILTILNTQKRQSTVKQLSFWNS